MKPNRDKALLLEALAKLSKGQQEEVRRGVREIHHAVKIRGTLGLLALSLVNADVIDNTKSEGN